MKNVVLAVAAMSLCSLPALAGAPPAKAAPEKAPEKAAAAPAPAAPAGMDMSKVGPWTRKPKNEKAVKKEIDAWFKAQEELSKKGDMAGMLAAVDFPVYMITDDAKGAIEASASTKEQYTEMMKPFYENMPKDMKVKHKMTVTVLSDNLAAVTDDFVQTTGKMKLMGRNAGLLVKKDGKWMWKMMAEAGWGGMGEPKPEMKGEMMKKETAPAKTTASVPAPKK